MNKVSWLIALVIALATAPALAVPQTVSFTGRLRTSSGVVNGSVNLIFRLFDSSSGTSVLWEETQTVTADNGLVYASLGAVTALTAAVLDGGDTFLEITVNSEKLSPRMKLQSVPYALLADRAITADTASSLDGVVKNDLVTAIVGEQGVAATKNLNTVTVGLSTSGCSMGQVYKYDGIRWNCAADNNSGTTYTTGTGISIAGTAISLSTTGCANGSVWKYNSMLADFACVPDADTTYAAGTGISISGTTVSLSTTGCVAGEVWKYNGTTFSCEPDASTTYTAGAGIAIGPGDTISLSSTGCLAGEVWRYNGTAFSCEPAYSDAQAVDAVTATTVTRTMTVGPSHFYNARSSTGTYLSNCTLPSTNCTLPSTAITLYVPMQIPVPAKLTQLSCIVKDDDMSADITVSMWNSSINVGAMSTSGTGGLQTITLTGFSIPDLTNGARGPAISISVGANGGLMQIYQCFVNYTQPALN